MELILNAGLGAGILMFLVLLFKQKKIKGDLLFLSWIFTILLQISFYEITLYHFNLNGTLAIIGFALPLLGSPLLFLYILNLTRKSISTIGSILHLSVFIIYILLLVFFKELSEASIVTTNGYLEINTSNTIFRYYYAIPLAISGVFYGIYDLFLLKQHRKKIAAFFSYKEAINLKWVQYIVYAFFLLVLITCFLIFGAVHFSLFKIDQVFSFVGTTLCVLLVAFGFYGFKQTEVFSSINFSNKEKETNKNIFSVIPSYSKSGLTKEKISLHAELLIKHMALNKPFLQENLSLPLLAEQCQLSQVQLSQVINQHFKVSFYDFINQHRVKEAEKRLVSTEFRHLSVLGIAYDCGFKSKSSFNRYFKKYCGISPSEYVKQNQK